jgi:hypothetical protein
MDRYQVELRPQGFAVVDQRRPNRNRPEAIWHARFKAQAVADQLNASLNPHS